MKQLGDMEYYSVYEFVADYKDGILSRRDMMRRVMHIAGGVASAASLLSLLGCGGTAAPASSISPASSAASPKPASAAPSSSAPAASAPASAKPAASAAASPAASGSAAAKPAASGSAAASGAPAAKSPISVPANDAAIAGKDVTFQGNGATLMAYEARPKSATGPLPLILVVHQNMGLNEHIRDVARRYAKEGYMASALDLLSRDGGTAKVAATDASKIPSMLSTPEATARGVADFAAAADYYAKQAAQVNPARLGMNGFCFGGGIVWRAAEQIPTLKAAVPFYGAVPPLDLVKNIKAAMFGVYSADPKDFANAKRADLETALKAANVTYQVKVYPGTQHAFNDDTGPRYVQAQALAAWKDALDWFAKYVKA
ncbi:MAG TPA: dienelactone hydrolase family protein [Chloroflexota bacterium]|nr:dienelactone hydrolase family protein [Chloroflexota bacterium]